MTLKSHIRALNSVESPRFYLLFYRPPKRFELFCIRQSQHDPYIYPAASPSQLEVYDVDRYILSFPDKSGTLRSRRDNRDPGFLACNHLSCRDNEVASCVSVGQCQKDLPYGSVMETRDGSSTADSGVDTFRGKRPIQLARAI